MFANIGIAINGLLRSRKFWLWASSLIVAVIMALFDQTPAAWHNVQVVFFGGASLLGITITVEDSTKNLGNKPPAG